MSNCAMPASTVASSWSNSAASTTRSRKPASTAPAGGKTSASTVARLKWADVQEKVAPGARGIEPDAEGIRLIERYFYVPARLLVPLHRFIIRPCRTQLYRITANIALLPSAAL